MKQDKDKIKCSLPHEKILIGVHNRLTTNKHAVLVVEYTRCDVETFEKELTVIVHVLVLQILNMAQDFFNYWLMWKPDGLESCGADVPCSICCFLTLQMYIRNEGECLSNATREHVVIHEV